MRDYKFTNYFENEVLRKRSYLKKEWCIRVIEQPIRIEIESADRVRFWGAIDELDRPNLTGYYPWRSVNNTQCLSGSRF